MLDVPILIQRASPFDDQASRLIDLLDNLQKSLYPPERCHMSSRSALAEENCLFLTGSLNRKIVGIGAVKICTEKTGTRYGEIKRVYITEDARGQGVGESLMAALEKHLFENEIYLSRLASGVHQPAAVRFYEKLAYEVRPAYDKYGPDELIVFMQKKLKHDTLASRRAPKEYFAVSFCSRLKPNRVDYYELAEKMFNLVQNQPGYLGVNSLRNSKGDGYSASYWADLNAVIQWRNNSEHQKAKAQGRENFYEKFKVHFAKINLA